MLPLFQIHSQVLQDGGQSLLDSLIASITAERSSLEAIRSEKDLQQCMDRLNGVRRGREGWGEEGEGGRGGRRGREDLQQCMDKLNGVRRGREG